MSRSLSGKIALVTGASSGIGEATAVALAQAGADVALSARRADRLHQLVKRIELGGGRALALPGDLTVESDAVRAVNDTFDKLGRLDILINSAGVMSAGNLEKGSVEEYRRVFDINLFATLYTCKAALPRMLAQGSGDIITISSLAARKGNSMTNSYSASKHAVNSMTDALRQEVGNRNIRVCILMPGATSTEVGDSISDPEWREKIQAHVSKEGAVQPAHVGETIVFILSLPRNVNISEICIRPTIDTTG